MTRATRRRVERRKRIIALVGLGFALGALTDAALTWRLHEFDAPEPAAGTPQATAERPVDAGRAPRAEPSNAAPIGTAGSEPAGPELDAAVASLRDRQLAIPVRGVDRHDLRDSFPEARALGRPPEAMDIMAARGTPVVAVDAGRIAKLFTSVPGGLTVYQFDPSESYSYYYAHLDSYAPDLQEGKVVSRGDVVGYVGTTGNATAHAPHLHFAIFKLTAEHQWWKGDPIDPFRVFEQ